MAACMGVPIWAGAHAQVPAGAPLTLEAKIALGDVSGRIDHMSFDRSRHRLFIAELGNNTVGVVDLETRKVVRRLIGFSEPQGVIYLPANDSVYVANGGDGAVKVFRGTDYQPEGRIDLGGDADNIRLDAATNLLLVGYGAGALAVVDPKVNRKVNAFALKAHPESFQINDAGNRVFVNLPNAHAIAVLDKAGGRTLATWPMRHGANFAMALDPERKRVLSVFRSPPKLAAFDMQSGAVVAETDTCGDVDDLFLDAKRRRIYLSCGVGYIDVLNADDAKYVRLTRIHTASGARTALFVPDIDRLLLAVRAGPGEPAAIWVYRPGP